MRKPVLSICEQLWCRSEPAHPPSLISTFVVRCLDSISFYIPKFQASAAEKAGLSCPWPETPKTGFLVTRLIYALKILAKTKEESHVQTGEESGMQNTL